jgi:hypothetical protein
MSSQDDRDTRVVNLGPLPDPEALRDLHGGRERLAAVREHFSDRVEQVQRIADGFEGVDVIDASESGTLIVTADASVWRELAGPHALLSIDGVQIAANAPVGLPRDDMPAPGVSDDPAGPLA